jgi:transcription antitermination factor NusG
MTPQWHVLYTRHRWETKVADRLADKKLEHYCPMNRVEKQGRKKMVSEVLFPSWVFVKSTASELTALRQVKGVVNLVYWLGKPVVVPENEMAGITQFVNEHTNISLDRTVVGFASEAAMIRTINSLDQYELETLSVPSLGIALSALVKLPQLDFIRSKHEFNNGLRYAIS